MQNRPAETIARTRRLEATSAKRWSTSYLRRQQRSLELKIKLVFRNSGHFARAPTFNQDAPSRPYLETRAHLRPSAEHRTFDPFLAIDEAVAQIKPQGHIARAQSALTREQRITENATYTEKLKVLGLQDPRSGVIGSGLTGLGQ